jgi:hypothetical protein
MLAAAAAISHISQLSGEHTLTAFWSSPAPLKVRSAPKGKALGAI